MITTKGYQSIHLSEKEILDILDDLIYVLREHDDLKSLESLEEVLKSLLEFDGEQNER